MHQQLLSNIRKSIFFMLFNMAYCATVNAQINWLRYNDDFSYLKNDSIAPSSLEKVKYLKLGRESTVSFGGELREQFQYYQNLNFGDVPPYYEDDISQVWQRIMLHSELKVNRKWRVFTQLNSTFRFFNDNPLTPVIDENQLSMHQLFVDYKPQSKWLVRLGRQEIVYDKHRLFTFREGPNTRQTFDALRIKHTYPLRSFESFIASQVVSMPGVFDDKSFEEVTFGAYATEKSLIKNHQIDYYILALSSDKRDYNYAGGDEFRLFYGLTVASMKKNLNYELAATYQSGKFNDLAINAYRLTADINYSLPLKIQTKIGISGDYITGDDDPFDDELNTYNLLHSAPPFGLTAPIGSANIIDMKSYITLLPSTNFIITYNFYMMWRESQNDGIYSPIPSQVRPVEPLLFQSSAKKIGNLNTVRLTYIPSYNFRFDIDVGYFINGSYVEETGAGEDITYLSFKGAFKF